jgi:predicted nucleic acid-binding protein
MLCVIDSSFAGAIFLPAEGGPRIQAVAGKIARKGAAAPAVWQLEMLNLLLGAERKGRITHAIRNQALDAFDALPITVEPPLTRKCRDDVMHLAERHRLTSYDAAYLELSARLNLPLATLDVALARAAKAEGLGVLP